MMNYRDMLRYFLILQMLLLSVSTYSQNGSSDKVDCTTQTLLRFRYDTHVLDKTQVVVYLKYSNYKIALLNDTIREFESSLYLPSKAADYILSVQFENKITGKATFNYSFALSGAEADIEINVRFWIDRNKKGNGSIRVIRYYDSSRNLYIRHLPDMEGIGIRGPFFLLENNSDDTIYGQHLVGYFWGSISTFIPDSGWSRDIFGVLDFNVLSRPPLAPDSTTIATVGFSGWRNVLPKARYRYTLLYRTRKSINSVVRRGFEKDNFTWRATTKKYYRLIYEFEVN